MKVLSIVVPCYHSEKYMRQCIDSLLVAGDDVEILIIDDGSYQDKTAQIADRYVQKYPGIVRCIHQKNLGHGGAINTGLQNAKGMYFKVVDSDDYVERSAYRKLIATLKVLTRQKHCVDMVFTNYVYENVKTKKQKVMSYKKVAKDKIITWKNSFHIGTFEFILMHSIIYKTELLKKIGLRLPEHICYEDDIYAFVPLGYVKSLYYLDVNLYHYSVGREGQTVNEQTLIAKIDDHIHATHQMLFAFYSMKNLEKEQRRYCIHFLQMMMCIADCVLDMDASKEAQKKKKELWKYVRILDRDLYRRLRYSIYGIVTTLPGSFGRKISVTGYKLARNLYGFN